MKKLFAAANHYVESSDWKIIAVLKFCLISLGMMIGMQIKPKYKKSGDPKKSPLSAISLI